MTDEHELVHLPRRDNPSIARSDELSGVMAARGRKDASSIMVWKDPPCLAAVNLDGKWGFIRADGRFAVEPKYAWVSPYSDGLAWFSFGDQPCKDVRFINWALDGFIEIPDQERFIFPYGLLTYESAQHHDTLGYFDREGRTVLAPTFHCAGPFKGGLARVATREKSGVGFIKRDGRFEIEPQFVEATDFQDGISIVVANDKYGLIDRHGRFISEPVFNYLWDLSEGVRRVCIGGKYGFLDDTGQFVIEPVFDGAWDFKEGLAPVAVGQDWGYIDKMGAFSIAPTFYEAECFSGGVAKVENWESDSPFHIDKAGNKVTIEEQKPDEKLVFSEGLARFRWRGKWGFADLSGRTMIEPVFESAGDFVTGLARVSGGEGLWGYINRTGDLIIPMQFGEARDFQRIEL